MHRMLPAALLGAGLPCAVFLVTAPATSAEPGAKTALASSARPTRGDLQVMVEAEVGGRKLEGLPLAWDAKQIHLLGRDGYLWEFRPDEAKNLHQTAPTFRSYSFSELRAALERELAGRLEISSTAHYLVAHPPGEGRKWGERFEELYRSFVHYFAVRGLKVREPEFPLVALVWDSKQDFNSYARSQGLNVPPGLLGFYSPVTNRITLFDSSTGKHDTAAWQQDASTIIHEATHQTAFNTSVHSRFAQPPRWLAEGLGMLFEAPGVYDSRHYPHDTDRINRGRLAQFRQFLGAGRPSGAFVALVDSDRLFELSPGAAYAEAWALTYYLSETQPRKYNDYLAKTAKRAKFTPYSSAQRLADFTAAFGSDLKMLEANYLRFIAGLKD